MDELECVILQRVELGKSVRLSHVLAVGSLPDPHVSFAAPLSAAAAAAAPVPGDDLDRLGRLPDEILRNVVSRLPAKDGARTAALATRWRGLWRSVPLTLVDDHLLPGGGAGLKRVAAGGDDDASRAIVAAASGALAAHPGPFRVVRLTWSHMASHRVEIKRWLQLLAAKGIKELDFINRPWPIDLPLPVSLFGCTSLTRLHIGFWRFPDTATLPHAATFPHLRELYLTMISITERDLALLLDMSPVLEVLTIIGSRDDVRLRLVSHSLRCLELVMCSVANIAVVDVRRLERLFVVVTMCGRIGSNNRTRISIGYAPNLHMLGYFLPGQQQLEIGSAIIEVGTQVSPSAMMPSFQTLALELQFETRNEVKAIPCLLKSFPNVKTLHIYSRQVDGPIGKVNLKFWQEAGPIECIQRHMKKLVFHGFKCKRSDIAFLKFIAEKARVLEKIVIVVSRQCFSSENDMKTKLRPLTTANWASEHFKLIVINPHFEEGTLFPWYLHMRSEFLCSDPFDFLTAELSRQAPVFHCPRIV